LLFATSMDFDGGYAKKGGRNDYSNPIEGMYNHLKGEYAQYNLGAAYGRQLRHAPTMVWVHADTLKPSISPKDR
jgi:hypothetical protein